MWFNRLGIFLIDNDYSMKSENEFDNYQIQNLTIEE